MTAGGASRHGGGGGAAWFSSRGKKTKCPLFFGCKLHAVNMVNCKTVLGCSLQLEATKLDKT